MAFFGSSVTRYLSFFQDGEPTDVPTCRQVDSGPRLRRWSGGECVNCEFGCGVLETEAGGKVLLATRWANQVGQEFPTALLDLSAKRSDWAWHECKFSAASKLGFLIQK